MRICRPIPFLVLGGGTTGTGYYLLDGDTAVTLEANSVRVGNGGAGHFDQVGGQHRIVNALTLAELPDSTGEYYMNGGQLTASTTRVGRGGLGDFEHRSGTHSTGHLVVGGETGGTGVGMLTLRSSGTLQLNEGLTGNGDLDIEGTLQLGSNIQGRQLRVGEFASTTAEGMHPGPHYAELDGVALGTEGR